MKKTKKKNVKSVSRIYVFGHLACLFCMYVLVVLVRKRVLNLLVAANGVSRTVIHFLLIFYVFPFLCFTFFSVFPRLCKNFLVGLICCTYFALSFALNLFLFSIHSNSQYVISGIQAREIILIWMIRMKSFLMAIITAQCFSDFTRWHMSGR